MSAPDREISAATTTPGGTGVAVTIERKVVIARWISIVAHPFVMIPLWIVAATLRVRGPADLVANVGVVALFVVVPNVVFMVWQVRRGAWANVDASKRPERLALYLVGLSSVALMLGWLAWGRSGSFLVRGTAVTLAMLAVCAVTSRWIKVSLHLAAAGITATSLALIGSPAAWIAGTAIPALAWSRHALGRHRPMEIVLGLAYGIAAGLALAWR